MYRTNYPPAGDQSVVKTVKNKMEYLIDPFGRSFQVYVNSVSYRAQPGFKYLPNFKLF